MCAITKICLNNCASTNALIQVCSQWMNDDPWLLHICFRISQSTRLSRMAKQIVAMPVPRTMDHHMP